MNILDVLKRDETTSHRRLRLGIGLGLVATALLFFTTLANNYTTARIQLTIDQANEDMLVAVASLPPGKDILLNIRYPNEYTDQIELQLGARFGRQKLDYATYLGGALPSGAFSLSPRVENQPRMSVRMGVNEPTQEVWVQSLHDQLMEQGANPIYFGSRSFRMMAFDFPRLFCPLATNLTFCSQPGPLVDRRVFQYGWEIQQIPVSAL